MEKELISRAALDGMHLFVAPGEKPDKETVGWNRAIDYVISNAPAVDAESVRHGSWKHIKKHLWYKDDNGDVDMWRVVHGFHNGPECEICGERFCEHCDPDWADDECEIGYYVCSECEQSTKTGDSPYCPNCGAKMDGDVDAPKS